MKKQIVIDIDDTGEVRIETRGYRGKSCIEETQFLKELLGEEIFKKLTPAYYVRTQHITKKKYLTLCG